MALLVALATGPAALAAGTVGSATGPVAAPRAVPPTPDRTVLDPRIQESSGLAVSRRHRGVLWTHNDSGGQAVVFAVGANGRTAARVRVKGVGADDWEAMASFTDAAKRPMLAVADIGDNTAKRSSVRIVIIPEPDLVDATVRNARVLRLTYPEGPVDAETILVDPLGSRAFIVTKGLGSTIYEIPPAAWRSSADTTATLVAVATVPLLMVTDGVMGQGGHPLLRTYSHLAVLPPLTDRVRGGAVHPEATMDLPSQGQGESLTLLDGSTALVGSEGKDQPILRVPLSKEVLTVLSPRSRPAPRAAGSTAARDAGPDRASAGSLIGPRLLPPTAGVLTAVLAGAWVLRRGRRRGGGTRGGRPSRR
jgi:hypothetical protein